MKKLYNEEIKEKFLQTYENEQTQKTIRNVFDKSELIESVLEKDLYDFTTTEIGKVIANANPHSVPVAKSISRFISQYISWAMPYRESNLNPLQGVNPDWYDNFVDHTKKIHYSYDEFIDLLEAMQNGQDQAFLFLIFEGIIGQKFSELRELHFSDINWDTNEVYIKERNEKIKVSADCMKYLDKAYKEKTYFTFNPETKEYNEKPLLDSEYVFKNLSSPRSLPGQMVNPSVFYTRLNNIKNEFELEYLTPNAIKQSGMLKMSADLYEEYGQLEYEQFSIIGDKYNYSKLTSNNYEYYNTNLMKEFVNPSNIKDLYKINVSF